MGSTASPYEVPIGSTGTILGMPNDWADFGPSADTESETFIAVDEPWDETVTDERAPEPEQDDVAEALPWSDPAPARPEEALARVETILDQVEQALTRLDDGTYGECGTCGSPIDDDQLEAAPTAQACASCEPVGA
jgi:RNA polymerase-binding transcription factor DksA